jgi:hypothetical protein
VEDLQTTGQTVRAVVRYTSSDAVDWDRHEQELVFTFASIAEKSPSSKVIVLAFFMGETPLTEMALATSDALACSKGTITAGQMMSRIGMTIRYDLEKKLAEDQSSRTEAPAKQEPLAKKEALAKNEPAPVSAMPALALRWPAIALAGLLTAGLGLAAAILALRHRTRPRPVKVQARLAILYEDGETTTVVLRGPTTTIGRAADNVVVLRDPHVSGRHAEISASDRGFEVTDLGSVNGTYVNGQRVSRESIYSGDEIVVGTTSIILKER